MQRYTGLFVAVLLAAAAFGSGIQFGQGTNGSGQLASLFNLFAAEPDAVVEHDDLGEFWEVWNLLDQKFAVGSTTQQLTREQKIQGAIDGLVDAYGDPYTVYLPPADAESFAADISGEFSGVGMEVGMRDSLVTIIAPLPETPAEQAGLQAGDVIIRIDDVSAEGMRIDQAVDLIRGEKGTVVTMTIFREGAMEFLEIPVTRDTIAIPTVKTEQIDDVFVIALYSFNAVAQSKMVDALNEYLQSDATKLVIDVRGNPGGFLESAVSIGSFFVPSGKIIVQESFVDESKNDTFRSRGRQVGEFNPNNLVILVDGGSASASEILAGALKDHGIATVIGAQTFGKGSVQELVELDGGASLKVTIARWLTPNGISISVGGLTPDITISRTGQQRLDEIDPQKDAAIKFLNGEVVVSESLEDDLLEESE
ncbi:MAG: carboxyl-terminal processing protease [Candidatus Paceibacteria bacterium]|jgi:carboxyl-terminal processing protease